MDDLIGKYISVRLGNTAHYDSGVWQMAFDDDYVPADRIYEESQLDETIEGFVVKTYDKEYPSGHTKWLLFDTGNGLEMAELEDCLIIGQETKQKDEPLVMDNLYA